VLKHELGVHLRQLLHGDKAFGDLQKSVEDRQNEQSVTGEAIRAAMKRVPKDTNPEHYWEEVLAYMVEQAPQVGIVRRLLALVKRALVKLGLDPKIFTVDDIAAMADVAVRSVGDGGDVNPRFSFAGVNAIGADKFTLAVAQVMEQTVPARKTSGARPDGGSSAMTGNLRSTIRCRLSAALRTVCLRIFSTIRSCSTRIRNSARSECGSWIWATTGGGATTRTSGLSR